MPKTKNIVPTKSSTKKGRNLVVIDFLKSQALCLLIYLSLFLIASIACLIFDLDYKFDFYLSLFAFALSSFFAGFLGGIKQREKGIVSGIIYALPGNIIFILLSVVLNGFSADYSLAISLLALVLLSAAGGVVAVNKRRRR